MTAKLPWEEAGATFDAERAKTLILNLRAEKEELKAKLKVKAEELAEALTAKDAAQLELETAKTAATELEQKLTQTTGELTAANLLRTKERILTEKGLPADMADFLTGEDDEALAAAADRLAALRPTGEGKPQDDNRPDPAQQSASATDERTEWASALFGN